MPVDVAGYAGKSPGFVACYGRLPSSVEKVNILVNLSARDLIDATRRLCADSYQPESIHVFLTADNEPRFSQIWGKTTEPRKNKCTEQRGLRQESDSLPFVLVSPGNPANQYSRSWNRAYVPGDYHRLKTAMTLTRAGEPDIRPS